MARLLDGIRVLDVASYIAGPVATTVMADFGASVIKIEPLEGDTYRRRSPGYPPSPYNFPWILDNRSKRGLALDVKRPEGRAVLDRLLTGTDVFVTNLPLDARGRLRVRYEDVAPLNERLIYASLTAYGEHGEEAAKTGYDSTALWARTGLMDLVRPFPDSPPARSLPGMGDHPAFAERDWADWRGALHAAGITFGVVGTLEDIPHDRQMRESGALVPIDDPRAGASLTVSSPVWIEGQEKAAPTLAPALGEHTTEILREAGLSQGEIDDLLARGVIAQGAPGVS